MQQYEQSTQGLVEAIRYFESSRSEAELMTFLSNIPETSGWVHPLLAAFASHRGKEAVLFLLPCPEEHEHVDLNHGPANQNSYTVGLLSPMARLISESTGKSSIGMNFHKQCWKPTRGHEEHCVPLLDREYRILRLANMVEVLIAKNVYGIVFTDTIAWSSPVVLSSDVVKPSDALDSLLSGAHYRLLGRYHRISPRPRDFVPTPEPVEMAQLFFQANMRAIVYPVLADVTRLSQQEVEQRLLQMYRTTTLAALKPVFDGTPNIELPSDPMSDEANRWLLAFWTVMARSPYAEPLIREGRLSTAILRLPREFPTDVPGPSVDGAITADLNQFLSLGPLQPSAGFAGAFSDALVTEGPRSPLLDPEWVLSAPKEDIWRLLAPLGGNVAAAVRKNGGN